MIQNETVKKRRTNMAMPFEPLSTEKLKNYFKKVIETNCNNQETNQCHKKHTDKISRNKLSCFGQVIETWIQREINS